VGGKFLEQTSALGFCRQSEKADFFAALRSGRNENIV
jgi:hypothetical protein